MQWQRIEHPPAPQGHALIVSVGNVTWRTYQLHDGQWLLESFPSGQTTTTGSFTEVRDLVDPRRTMEPRKTRQRNGAGTGAFLGSLLGSLAGIGVGSAPLAGLGSIVGGGIGGAVGAQPDRRKRGAGGGAVGGALLGPLGAGIGGYIGGRHPDYDFQRQDRDGNPRDRGYLIRVEIWKPHDRKNSYSFQDEMYEWPNEENIIDHILDSGMARRYSNHFIAIDDEKLLWKFRTKPYGGSVSVAKIGKPKPSRKINPRVNILAKRLSR